MKLKEPGLCALCGGPIKPKPWKRKYCSTKCNATVARQRMRGYYAAEKAEYLANKGKPK